MCICAVPRRAQSFVRLIEIFLGRSIVEREAWCCEMAWQALPQQLAQLPCRLQHRGPQPRLPRRCLQQTRAAVLSTPVEEQAQRKSTLEALQSAVTITAGKTPYLENGKIDLREYDRLVERQIEGGVEGVIVGGTTGEGQV